MATSSEDDACLTSLLAAGGVDDAPAVSARLVARAGSITALLARPHLYEGADRRPTQLLAACRALSGIALRRALDAGPILSSSQAVLDHLHHTLANERDEQLRVLFLDIKFRLLREETVTSGTLDEALINPRSVLRRALELNAAALILAHNHPSGDPRPSASDRRATIMLAAAAKALGIQIVDHIVIGRGGHSSLRASGML